MNCRVSNSSSFFSFLTGESRHGLYNSHRLRYSKGQVAQCSTATAIALTVFVFSVIFLSSLSLAFIRPFDFSQECAKKELPEFVEVVDEDEYEYYEESMLDMTATNGQPFPWDDIRLPTFIQPVRYDIELTPNLTSLWVKGIEKFFFTVSEETNFIVFHSKGIDISSRTINERLKVERMLEFPAREQVYLETDEYMVPGVTYALRLKFSYMLSNHLEGFYYSEYFDKEGIKHRIGN